MRFLSCATNQLLKDNFLKTKTNHNRPPFFMHTCYFCYRRCVYRGFLPNFALANFWLLLFHCWDLANSIWGYYSQNRISQIWLDSFENPQWWNSQKARIPCTKVKFVSLSQIVNTVVTTYWHLSFGKLKRFGFNSRLCQQKKVCIHKSHSI